MSFLWGKDRQLLSDFPGHIRPIDSGPLLSILIIVRYNWKKTGRKYHKYLNQ